MNWLDRLKAENSGTCTPSGALPELPKAPSGSKGSAPHSAHGENFTRTTRPAANDAQPVRQQEPARSCRTCRHLKRPGLSDGHRGGRDDLPHAYTAGHPLRRLPADGGASCGTWEALT